MSDVTVQPLERLAYSVKELAEATGLSDQTIYDAIKANELEARFVGRKAVIPVAAAKAWIDRLPDSKPA